MKYFEYFESERPALMASFTLLPVYRSRMVTFAVCRPGFAIGSAMPLFPPL